MKKITFITLFLLSGVMFAQAEWTAVPSSALAGKKYTHMQKGDSVAGMTYIVELEFDANGNLKVAGGASSVTAEYMSPFDFTATYTSSTTIMLSGLPFTISNNSQVAYIKQIKADSTSALFVNGSAGITIYHSANVLTIFGGGTPFATGDVYQVGINAQKKAYSLSLDQSKVGVQNPEWAHYTTPETLVDTTNKAITYSYARISMAGYRYCSIHIVTTDTFYVSIFGTNNTASGDTTVTTEWANLSTLILGASPYTPLTTSANAMYFVDTAMMPDRFNIRYRPQNVTSVIKIFIRKY